MNHNRRADIDTRNPDSSLTTELVAMQMILNDLLRDPNWADDRRAVQNVTAVVNTIVRVIQTRVRLQAGPSSTFDVELDSALAELGLDGRGDHS